MRAIARLLALPIVGFVLWVECAEAQHEQHPTAATTSSEPRFTREDFDAYLRALQAHDYDGFLSFYTEDVLFGVPGTSRTDRTGIVAMERGLAEAWDWTMRVLQVVVGDDGIAMRAVMEGPVVKESPALSGLFGEHKAGEHWSLTFAMFYTLRDGKIAEITPAQVEARKL
jgi:ketosteroid isomerase-like protein